MKVRDVGEQQLLQRLQAYCPSEIVGDDAAILQPAQGRSLVVTSDMLVDRVHFSHETTTPEDAGWRAAAANLSDLAAMGATPLGIAVGLGLPGDLSVEWVERLYQGLTACLNVYGTVIVGGDVVRSPITTLAITALGEVNPKQVIQRCQAQPGYAIVVTGYHGSSRAGLELLLNPEKLVPLNESDRADLIRAHQRPFPRLDVLPMLQTCFSANAPFAIAGMDSSDGLADAVLQICRASGVGAQLDRSQIPVFPALKAWVGSETALEWALYGGEDFELVLCLPPETANRLVQQLGRGAAIVGSITSAAEVCLIDSVAPSFKQLLTFAQGFQHFSPGE